MNAPRFRPLLQGCGPRPDEAVSLAGWPLWFDRVAVHERERAPEILPVSDLPDAERARFTAPRAPVAGLDWSRPRLMGILNVTPDSFSDGGRHLAREDALAQAQQMVQTGADMIDVGGESTRPGAETVAEDAERVRVLPVISAIRAAGLVTPISIDTRKAAVARAALAAGADLVNDVAGLGYDPEMSGVVRERAAPVCLMHAQGDPETMQDAPHYADVVLDVYDWLEARVARCEAEGIARARIVIDPGIGFGKTLDHNLALLRHLAIFHGIGCVVLLGASRKRFVGTIGGEPDPALRAPGSIAVALEALRQGVQMLRIHDVKETRQAVSLWEALNGFT